MAKRKNNMVRLLLLERYLLWAVAIMIMVEIALLGQIAIAKSEMDANISSWLFLTGLKHK